MIRNFSLSFTLLLITLDSIAILVAITIAEWQRLTLDFGSPAPDEVFATPWWVFGVLLVAWILILNAVGAYSPQQTYRAILETMHQLQAVLIAVFVFGGIFFVTYRDFSRLQFIYLLIDLALLNVGLRLLLRLYYRLRGGRKYDSRRILIIGTGELAQTVGMQVRSYAWTGLYLVGYISITEHDADETEFSEKINVIGKYEELPTIIEAQHIDEIIFALKQPQYNVLATWTKEIYTKHQIRVRIAPDFQDLAYLVLTVENMRGLPLVGLRDYALTLPQRVIKRGMDIVISATLLLLTLPLMIIISIVIMVDSAGSPFFIQERVAQGMRPFKMIKFRTMVKDAEALQSTVNRYDIAGNIIHKTPDDTRITRVGRFLRQTSLDELPQFWNVLKGDMSLVGPRPEMPWMVDRYQDWQIKRFEVPQGLTGWWQINGRSETPMHLAIEDDLFYIINYSIMLDIIILLRTPFTVLRGNGAF